jgi:hypothetical protein
VYHIIWDQCAHHRSNEVVENNDYNDRTGDANWDICGMIFNFLRQSRNDILPNVAEVNIGCNIEHLVYPIRCKIQPIDSPCFFYVLFTLLHCCCSCVTGFIH